MSAAAICIVAIVSPMSALLAQEPAQPDAAPPPQPVATQAPATADRMAVTFTSADGTTARTVIIVRADPGNAAEARPPRLRLTLGRLEALFTPGKMVATYRGEPSSYFEAALPEQLTPESIRAALPRLPIPQIQWAFADPSAAPSERSNPHPFGMPTTPLPADADGTQHFAASDGRLDVLLAPRTSRPRQITLHANDASILQLDLSPIDARDPATWTLSIEGRHRVASFAELRSKAQSPLIGQTFKDIGFTRPDFSNVTLQDLLLPKATEAAAQVPTPNASIFLVFATGSNGQPAEGVRLELAAAREALRSAIEQQPTSPEPKPDPKTTPRLALFLVRALPLAALDIPAIENSADALLAEPSPQSTSVQALNTSAGDWLLKEQLSGASIGLVILNAQRVVTFAAPIDGRGADPESLSAELHAALTQALATAPTTPKPQPPK